MQASEPADQPAQPAAMTVEERDAVRARLAEIMAGRVDLPRGTLGSASDDERLNLPAILGEEQRILLGDIGHVSDLLEDEGSDAFVQYLKDHPVKAVLVCLGADAAQMVSSEFEKLGLAYIGLDGCIDELGYPLLEKHLDECRHFISSQLQRYGPDGCVLVHCHEGRNRSAALCIAYLMVEQRMPLYDAVEHVWTRRPNVLSNGSFLEQLIDLAAREQLL